MEPVTVLFRRTIYSVSSDTLGITDINSHVNTCSFVRHERVKNHIEQAVSLSLFHNILPDMRNIPIFNAVIYYDEPDTYQINILLLLLSLYYKDMGTNLFYLVGCLIMILM